MPRRERATILGELLEVLEAESTTAEPTSLARLAARANVPYDRFTSYVDELARGGLVEVGARPRLTQAGRDVLERYRSWREALRLFGLGPLD